MIITGGAYYEECQFPPETDFFGPGIRAAAATESRSPSPNTLHTCVAEADLSTLNTYADTYNFEVSVTEIPKTVTFDYLHNHSNNQIWPKRADQYDVTLTGISGEAVLRYGLIEGTAVVSGERVVYDPQASEPEPFHANGSSADELALVLNVDEAAKLSEEETPNLILTELTAGETSADVVVLKRGPKGAIVRTPEATSNVPAFRTDSVWGIGSGDIFSAVFAAEWAVRGQPAPDAALTASRATAYYCSWKTLPITETVVDAALSNTGGDFIAPDEPAPTIYLAGPFFDVGELFVVEEVKHILENEGVDVISPVHDIGRAADYDSTEDVAKQDLAAIDEADLVFALLDHVDSGTHFEIGYARKAGTPVIGYAHNPNARDYTMIQGSGCKVYSDLSSAIYQAVWKSYA